ncbi:mitochondrial proton/calcium exchanger protein-like protein isoform X1 [Tanacetum coccineum]
MSESTKRHEENSNLIKEIRASTDAAIRNQGASIKTLEIQIGQMSKVLQERGFGSLPSSTKTNPRDHVKSISTIVEADSYPIRRMGSSQYAVSTGQNRTLMYETKQTTILFPSRLNGYYCEEKKGSYGPQFSEAYSEASHINNSIPRKEKDLGSFTLPCFINNVCFDNALADLGASVSVMPLSTYLNLGLGELAHTKLTVELADRTVKYPKGIAENMLVGIGKFVFPIDFIILDMPEDIKVPLILGRPFLSTAHAKIDVFKRKITLRVGEEKIIFKSVKPARSLIKRVYMLSLRERMKLDLEARLMGETLVLDRSLYPFFKDYIELNDLNVPLELRRDQVDDLIPTNKEDFTVLEDMDAYHDEGMGDVIFGEPFLREVRINAKQFEGMITIHNGNEEVTYHMTRSHPRTSLKEKEIDNVGGESMIWKSRSVGVLKPNRRKMGNTVVRSVVALACGFGSTGYIGWCRLGVTGVRGHEEGGGLGVAVTFTCGVGRGEDAEPLGVNECRVVWRSQVAAAHWGFKRMRFYDRTHLSYFMSISSPVCVLQLLVGVCMTRSLTKELFTPFKDPEREFRSSRKHFKTLSLDESRSPDFDLFSDQEEYSEEEVTETMAETMEQYMSKTRADYGSGVARPKIKDRDNFELDDF